MLPHPRKSESDYDGATAVGDNHSGPTPKNNGFNNGYLVPEPPLKVPRGPRGSPNVVADLPFVDATAYLDEKQ